MKFVFILFFIDYNCMLICGFLNVGYVVLIVVVGCVDCEFLDCGFVYLVNISVMVSVVYIGVKGIIDCFVIIIFLF